MESKYISADVWMVDAKGNVLTRMRRQKIFLHTKDKGVIVDDGREVIRKGDRWVYIAR